MEKSCQSSLSADSSAANNGRNQYLKHLNKLSHKISKPSFVKNPDFDSSLHSNPNFIHNRTLPPPPPLPESAAAVQAQPLVYNINKNDFRDVVQKLTGSPAHDRFSNPPPIHLPKPHSSRLHRIRPPPLANLGNRPVSIPQPQQPPPGLNPRNSNFVPNGRPVAPLSPLPPLPAVHAPAESPVSAYMRYLQNSFPSMDSNEKQFWGFLSPPASRWNNVIAEEEMPAAAVAEGAIPAAMGCEVAQFPMPLSPVPFGCMNSAVGWAAYPVLWPAGYPQFPLSPRVGSPRWRDMC